MKQHADHKEYEAGDKIELELVNGKPETKTIISVTSPKYDRWLGDYQQTLNFGPGTQPVTI